jgi:murein tripeptide amidase MpaA
MPYLNVVEIESALESFAGLYPTIITRFALPNQTWENRTCHGVKIANGGGDGRIGVYFIGGVHAREWVCSDILVNFIEQLADAYNSNSDLTIGGVVFSEEQITRIADNLDVFVFPQTNPDGRNKSLSGDNVMWRKNLSPAPGSHPGCPGVDINRNYDFLWDYPLYFHPDVMDDITWDNIVNSKNPCDSTYIGSAAVSEPETQNIVWMFSQNPHIRYFVDVHSYSELILFDWGDDEDQVSNPEMNFRNPAFDGQRGVVGDAYGEYISAGDRALRMNIANRVRDTIQTNRGRVYTVQQSFGLYPTAGTSTDYFGGRCFIETGAETVHAFTFECGQTFFPSDAEREEIITEITAGLLEFCLAVLDVPADVYVRDNLQDTGAEPTPDGGLSMSPDIHHYRDTLTDPQATLGSQAAKNRNDLFETIEKGQNNFIYVRLQNRGSISATTEIDVYWTRPSTLPVPGSWELIGTLNSPALPPGELTVVGPLTWPLSDIPESGHYCFISVFGSENDPKPDIDAVHTIDDFYRFIRENNNVAWKNFDVQDQFSGSMLRFEFLIRGWSKAAYISDLEIDLTSLARNAEVELKIVKRLTDGASPSGLTKIEDVGPHSIYNVETDHIVAMRNMSLRSGDKTVARLTIHLSPDTPHGFYDIAAIQRIAGKEVGRVTKRLIVGDHPFIANRRSGEVHKANCPFIPLMSGRNKRAYREVELALKHGYNGCHTCLPEFDTG